MRGAVRSFRSLTVGLLALLLAGAMLLGQAGSAVAYWEFTDLDGLQQAVTREFFGDAYDSGYISIEIYATIARFDTEANAEAGYDEVTRQYASGFGSVEAGATPEAAEIAGLGDAAMEFTEVMLYEPELGWYLVTTVAVSRQATEIHVVTATFLHDQKPGPMPSSEVARSLLASMLSAEAGEGEGVEVEIGSYSGGLWDKLPTLEHEALAPFGLTSTWDSQDYPYLATPEDDLEEDEAFDFGGLEGIERAVARFYAGDMAALESPEAAPAGTYFLTAVVVAFDSEDNAAAALVTLSDESAASLAAGLPFSLDDVDAGDLGDEAVARFGSGEDEGVTYEVAVVTVRDGSLVYLVAAIGVGAEAGTQEVATGVVEAMIAAEPGDGEGEYDPAGGSTGGPWEVLPVDGDSALAGLTVDSDELVYPEPEE